MDRKIKRETRPRGYGEYHITWCAPNDIWPRGAWSFYRITGDEIAQRVIWASYELDKGYPTGKVKFRHPWSGYIGMFETWDELEAAIEKGAQEVVTFVSYEDEGAAA